MIRMNTDLGQITVDSAVYTNIAGFAATNTFYCATNVLRKHNFFYFIFIRINGVQP